MTLRRRLPALLLGLLLILPAAGQTVPRTREFRTLCDTLSARLKRRTTVDFRLSVSKVAREGNALDLTFNNNLSYFPWHSDDVEWFREQLTKEWSFKDFTPGKIESNGYELDELVTPKLTSDGKPYIITQPTDYTGKVSEYEGPRAEAAGGVLTRYATFKVYAGGEDLQYQWWQKWDKDPDTSWMPAEGVDGSENAPTLKVEMNIEECNGNFYRQFKCDVFNEIDNVTTNVANLKPKHVFGFYYSINDETHGYYCVGGCGERLRTSKHRFNDWTLVKPATSDETGLREQVCRDCSFAISEVIPKVEPNHVHSFDVARHSLTQHWFVCRCGVIGPDPKEDHNFDETEVVTEPTEKRMGESNLICSACGYYKTVKTDKLPHVHDYYSINDEGMFITKNGKYVPDPQKCKRGPLSHSFKCKGCDEWIIENHTWEMWLCARVPKSADEPGRMVRQCQTCYYEETKFFPYGSYPVMIEGGTADRDYAKE